MISSLAIDALEANTTAGAGSSSGRKWEAVRRGGLACRAVFSFRTKKQSTHPLLAASSSPVKAHAKAHRQNSTMKCNDQGNVDLNLGNNGIHGARANHVIFHQKAQERSLLLQLLAALAN
jgi:hypothetical protein